MKSGGDDFPVKAREETPTNFSPEKPAEPDGRAAPKREDNSPRSWSYPLAFGVVALLIAGLVGLLIQSEYWKTLDEWKARQSSFADDRARMVSNYLEERHAAAQIFAARPLIRAALQRHYDADHPSVASGAFAQLRAVLDDTAGLYAYVGVYLLNRDAGLVAQSSGSAALGPRLREICRTVARTGMFRIDVLGDAPHETQISIGVPVFTERRTPEAERPSSAPLGMALVVFDAARGLFPLVTRESVPTWTGETLLARREGNEVVLFSPLRHIPAGSPQLRFPLPAAPLPARIALEGQNRFVEYNDYRGVPVLASTQRIPLTGWGLVRKIDRAEALESFRRQAIIEGVAGGLLVLLLGGGLLMSHRRHVLTCIIKQEEEKFRALLESAPDAIYIVEAATLRILGRNRRAAEMDGYSEEELAGMTAADLHPPEERHSLFETPADPCETGPALQTHTLHHQKKDGQLVLVEESHTLVEVGGQRFILSIVRDVTERQRAEEGLRRQAALLDQSFDAVFAWEVDGPICYWNQGAERLYGFSSAGAMGRIPRELLKTEFPTSLQDCRNGLERKGYWEGELNHQTRDGRPMVVESRMTLVRQAGGNLVLEANRDVTERQRAEEALRRANAYNRSLIEASLDPLVTISPEGKITDVNSATEKATGRLRAELVGTDFSDYFTDPERARAGYQRVFREGSVQDYELEIRHREGHLTPVLYNASVYRGEAGQVVGVFAAARDITERRKAEEEIRQLNASLEERVRERTAQLEAANKELEAFTYSVSHDLRAPLRHVDGFSRLLLEEFSAQLPETGRHYLERIRNGTRQMGQLVDDLLNLSRVGRRELSIQITGLSSLAQEVVSELKAENPQRKIHWKIGPLPFVECDPLLMKQVLRNLLSNAVKFTRPREEAVVEVGTRCQNGRQAVFVRDNGVGFSMKYADKLFGVFQRLHRGEDFEGTGVGLATVQRIVHKHHGEVWAEAELDRGATFYFTLGTEPAAINARKGEAT
jgi:PAS domain S-box-containing protein